MTRKKYFQQGFSLVELMVVIVIIGMLAGIVTVSLGGRLGDARVKTTKAQMGEIQKALKMFEMRNSRFPTKSEGLKALTESKNGGPFIQEIKPDAWGRKLKYRTTGNKYEIISYGADGSAGGEGYDEDIKLSNRSQ